MKYYQSPAQFYKIYFLIYKGYNKLNIGNFTNGKLYTLTKEIGSTQNESVVFDDNNQMVVLKDFSEFDCYDWVYGVITNQDNALCKNGKVVQVTGIYDQKVEFQYINGDKSVLSEHDIKLIDYTIIKPQIMIFDCTDLYWKHINYTFDHFKVSVNHGKPRQLFDFEFALSKDGEILDMKLVRCIDNTGLSENFTVGNLYNIIARRDNTQDTSIWVIGDNGEKLPVRQEHFEKF